MTQFKKRLIDLKFISSEFLSIEPGRSSRGSIIIRGGTAVAVGDTIDFALGEEYQVEIEGGMATVGDLKEKIAEKYNIPQGFIRVREFKVGQFRDILGAGESLARARERSRVWEETECEDPRGGMQVYFRVFDAVAMELGPLLSVFLQSGSNYE
jgi:hypothetical protein